MVPDDDLWQGLGCCPDFGQEPRISGLTEPSVAEGPSSRGAGPFCFDLLPPAVLNHCKLQP
jgi:hypothetical protein